MHSALASCIEGYSDPPTSSGNGLPRPASLPGDLALPWRMAGTLQKAPCTRSAGQLCFLGAADLELEPDTLSSGSPQPTGQVDTYV